MFDISTPLFFKELIVPKDVELIFVSDIFVEEYVGGAELTSEALIQSSTLKLFKVHSKDVTQKFLEQNTEKFWIFGNFATLDMKLIPLIVANIKYAVCEYDYKYCKYRSSQFHEESENKKCDCEQQISGKVISAFYHGAKQLFWMSEKQKNVYLKLFPFLSQNKNTVLSSVFSHQTLEYIKKLREQNKNTPKTGWIVLGSNSWVKGYKNALETCKTLNTHPEIVWNVPYEKLLERLSMAEGLIYVPVGADTCPRLVVEAKLLGCKLVINDFVQHKDEKWFDTDDLASIEEYLSRATKIFWDGVKEEMYRKQTISGYITTYNCITQTYPYEKCIRSLLNFCNEVCVVDGGSTDGTWERLSELSLSNTKIKIKQIKRDWSSSGFAVFDGQQKAEARKMCVSDFCWQADVDEIFHENDAKRISDLCKLTHADLIALPVLEWWGSYDKVRIDVTPWKWRFSRNKPYITHGIPKELRKTDKDGRLFSLPGSDGCDYINKDTFERVPFVSFYTQEADNVRRAAIAGNTEALKEYERWFNQMINSLPTSFHYSWLNIDRKIKLYRDYWSKHWNDLSNQNTNDSSETNMFFDVPWSEVTDEMITIRAKELEKTGGHVFHSKWDGKITPWIKCDKKEPNV